MLLTGVIGAYRRNGDVSIFYRQDECRYEGQLLDEIGSKTVFGVTLAVISSPNYY